VHDTGEREQIWTEKKQRACRVSAQWYQTPAPELSPRSAHPFPSPLAFPCLYASFPCSQEGRCCSLCSRFSTEQNKKSKENTEREHHNARGEAGLAGTRTQTIGVRGSWRRVLSL
jgi:hypothetical protein